MTRSAPDLEHAHGRLRAWIETNGWAGWDPYDVRGHRLYLATKRWSNRGRAFGIPLGILYHADKAYPMAMRKMLRIRPQVNAKGMGLLARTYHLLGRRSGDAGARSESSRRIGWLLENRSETVGAGWGYPFDWESDCFVPAGTPSAVVTATVADALRTAHDVGGDARHGDTLHAVATFFESALHRTETDAGVCFSYTPLDRFCVLNASLMVGEYLHWAADALERPELRPLADAAVRYVVSHQRADGAWDYWGPEHPVAKPAPHIDAYHTGFVLRMLLRVLRRGSSAVTTENIRSGYAFFETHLMDGPRPRNTTEREFPVDVHAVAEAVLLRQAMRDVEPGALDRAHETVRWAVEHMQTPSGHFGYLWSPRRVNRLPVLRWGQAWMLLALTALGESEAVL